MESITINGLIFKEIPAYCGVCPAYSSCTKNEGFCALFWKKKYACNNTPKRCLHLISKGFSIGGDLVIVINN